MLIRFGFARGSELDDQWFIDQGYTLVWLGWEWDIPASSKTLLHFSAPHFRPDAPTNGLVRSEFVTDKSATRMPLGDRNQEGIPVAKAVALYMRDAADTPAKRIPADRWKVVDDGEAVELAAGVE